MAAPNPPSNFSLTQVAAGDPQFTAAWEHDRGNLDRFEILWKHTTDSVWKSHLLAPRTSFSEVFTVSTAPTFTRSSIAYKRDGSSVVSGAVRYETGKYGQAITIEEATTNHALWSDDFSNVVWEKYRATITPNAATAPDGTLTADKLVEDTTNNTHEIAQPSVFVLTTTPAATSIIAKAGERSWIATVFGSATPTYFNLANGTVGTVGPGVTASITALGNGWYWCRASIAAAAYTHYVSWNLATADGVSSYLGDGASGVYIWRAHGERKTYPTTPVKTEGATAARTAESLTIPTSGVLGAATGTVEFWVKPLRSPGTNEMRLFDGAGGANTNLVIGINTAGKVVVTFGTGGATSTVTGTTTLANGTLYHVAVTYDASAVTLYINGTAEGTPGGVHSFSFGTNAYLGSTAAGASQAGGLIDDLRVSNIARTASEIATTAGSASAAAVDGSTTYKLPLDSSLAPSPGVSTYTTTLVSTENTQWAIRALDAAGNVST